jgi:hypothetical protein
MPNLKDKIWKQRTIGQAWGRFALAGSQIAIFVSTWTMLMVTINAYAPVSEWLVGHGIHLRFWMFAVIAIIPIVVAYFLSWKLLVATFYRSSTEQFWEQSKEWTERLKKIDKIDTIEKAISEIKESIRK